MNIISLAAGLHQRPTATYSELSDQCFEIIIVTPLTMAHSAFLFNIAWADAEVHKAHPNVKITGRARRS